jgi:uncharacterized membrane protein
MRNLPLFPPELLILVGVDVFVFLSLLTSIFDEPFPMTLPYVFQITALAGFGEVWVGYAFLLSFVEARFWCSALYLAVALLAVIAINLYIAINKRLLNTAIAFLGTVTIPTIFMSFLLASAYVNGLAIWMPPLPIVPVEAIYVVLTLCMVIFGLSIITYFEPKALKNMFKRGQKSQYTFKSLTLASPIDEAKQHKKERR